MKLYIDISSIGSSCGVCIFTPVEYQLLYRWAKNNPDDCRNFLISKGLITQHSSELNDNCENVTPEIIEKITGDISPDTTIEDINHIKKKNRLTNSPDISFVLDREINKKYGILKENGVIDNLKFEKSNNKMYYYSITPNIVIGGKNDSLDGETVIEIKNRTKRQNIKKNKSDLYQLLGYMLAMRKNKGKIIQSYDGDIYSSDIETPNEYGLVEIEKYSDYVSDIFEKLKLFYKKVVIISKNKKMDEPSLYVAIPPGTILCNYVDGVLSNKNISYNKLLNCLFP